jgi:MazG family protein
VLGLGGASDATVADLTDEALADGRLLLPPLDPERDLASPHGLAWLVARLRAPGGCPWDREQTHLTLRKFLLEEAYEVYDALEDGSTPALAEELGDLLLQIVLHAHYGAEAGVFDLADVHHAIMTKIIRRHPHVFGGVEARSVDQVLRNWELIKADERATRSAERPRGPAREAGERPGMPEAFAGLSTALPALAYAQEIQERAASLGYDWPQIVDIAEKVDEEVAELVAAVDETARREEVGDLLLVIVNLARRLGVDAEAALRRASAKFAARFAHVERLAADRGVDLRELDLDALDELWQAAKRVERDAVGMR